MRLALRALARTPSFAAIAILTLAIGIGTNVTIFAIVDQLAFRLARGTTSDGVYQLAPIQVLDYEALSAEPPAGVAALAAYEMTGGVLQSPGRAENVAVWRVSGGYAAVQNVRAQAGRWITDEDNAGGELDPGVTRLGVTRRTVYGRLGAPVMVISDRIWREWFGASTSVVGQTTMLLETIGLGRKPFRIVGVAPPGFEVAIDVWTPFGQRRQWTGEELEALRPAKRPAFSMSPPRPPRQPSLRAVLRKAPGASDAVVKAQLTAAVAARTETTEQPRSRIGLSLRRGDDRLMATGYTILIFAALIFAAACANLGNMLLARAGEREGELAVRLSLGATRLDVFKLLLAETTLICAAASGLGLLFASVVLRLFTDAFPAFEVNAWERVPIDLSVDWRIAGYAAAAGIAAAVLVGAGALWRSSRLSLLSRLTASGPAVIARTEGRTLKTMLVAVQVTVAVLLLIATGLLLENSSRRLNKRVLFDTDTLASARIVLGEEYDEARGRHFFTRLLERVRAIDGVTSAALADALPGGQSPPPRGGVSAIVGEPPEQGLAGAPRRIDGRWLHVSPGFVDTLGLRLVRGRDIQEIDEAGSDLVALVTESTAERLWPGADPISRRLNCCGARPLRRVVGVVSDPTTSIRRALTLGLGEAIQLATDGRPDAFVFVPAAQRYDPAMLVVVRSDAPRAVIQPIRDAVAALDPAVPVFHAGPANATQFSRAASERAVRLLAGALGAIALGISVLGIYALVSYFASRRTREFGVRLALGAPRARIVQLVVDYAIHVVLIGLLPGVLLASLGTRYFQRELVGLHPNGVTMWVVVPVLMLLVGVIAATLPARRAARVDPYRSLKDL